MRGNGKRIVGRNYVPSCGRCSVLPWESCACSALLPELPEPIEVVQGIAESFNAEAQQRLAFAMEENR